MQGEKMFFKVHMECSHPEKNAVAARDYAAV